MFEITHRHQQVRFSLAPLNFMLKRLLIIVLPCAKAIRKLFQEPISLKSSDFYSLIQYCTIFSLVIAILFNEQNGEFRIPGIIPFKNLSGDLSAATVTTAISMETMMTTRVVVSASAECSSSSRDQNVAHSKENMIL